MHVLANLANLVDAAVAGAVDLEDVHVFADRDRLTHLALAARRGGRALGAVERLGEDAGRAGLAHAARAGEEIGMRDPPAGDRVGQGLSDRLLADQIAELLRPIPARGGGVSGGRRRGCGFVRGFGFALGHDGHSMMGPMRRMGPMGPIRLMSPIGFQTEKPAAFAAGFSPVSSRGWERLVHCTRSIAYGCTFRPDQIHNFPLRGSPPISAMSHRLVYV